VVKYKGVKTGKVDITRTIELMLKNIKIEGNIYIVFSKKSFRVLVFTLGMSIIANIIIIILIIHSLSFTMNIDTFIYIVMLILSIITVLSGLWLVFKGIDIVTEDIGVKGG
jgi:hypothetical protein